MNRTASAANLQVINRMPVEVDRFWDLTGCRKTPLLNLQASLSG